MAVQKLGLVTHSWNPGAGNVRKGCRLPGLLAKAMSSVFRQRPVSRGGGEQRTIPASLGPPPLHTGSGVYPTYMHATHTTHTSVQYTHTMAQTNTTKRDLKLGVVEMSVSHYSKGREYRLNLPIPSPQRRHL